MNKGRKTCEELKRIRKQLANDNGISYCPSECKFEGECSGTCPKCDSEIRYIENELALRQLAGKAIKIMGVAASMTLMTACNPFAINGHLEGSVPAPGWDQQDTTESETANGSEKADSTKNNSSVPLKDEEEKKQTD